MGWIGQSLAAVLVIALLLGTLAVLRRKGWVRTSGRGPRMAPPRSLELVDRLALTPQHSLHYVRLGSRAILIGRSPGGLTLLDNSEWAASRKEAKP